VRERSNITVFEQTLVLDLWMAGDRCHGAIVSTHHRLEWWPAGAVVLATGGGGQVFAETTNPKASTGDGVAMAWRAGAQLRDLEFFQFHPTALKVEGAPRFLISEAVRGEGAHLIDAQGHRFTFDYHPQGELAPRDIVSRAIYRHLSTSELHAPDWVWLDLRPIPSERAQYRFPNILAVCRHWGIDPLTQPIPVSPAAHYWMGGVVTDLTSGSSLSRLYVVGETASTGVHGANRLASNSLLECLVYGRQLEKLHIGSMTEPLSNTLVSAEIAIAISAAEIAALQQIRTILPEVVWQGAGISRQGNTMAAAIAQVDALRSQFAALKITHALLQSLEQKTSCSLAFGNDTLRLWTEVRNLLDLAHLILQSANFRPESRGGHYRSDFPQPNPDWQVHTMVQGDRYWAEPT
jgi:L-aspartate oxidase